jgi:hypothetical protein
MGMVAESHKFRVFGFGIIDKALIFGVFARFHLWGSRHNSPLGCVVFLFD